MGSYTWVCFSTHSDDTAGARQAQAVSGCRVDSHCSDVVPEALVSRPPGASVGASCSSSSEDRSVKATPLSQVLSKPTHASSACVESIECFAKAAGVSGGVARHLARVRRQSSIASYQAK